MALVTCPGCKRIVNDSSGKCPNCGAAFKAVVTRGGMPAGILRTISSVLITVSCVLMFIELFELAKTYVGGLLLGAGFFIHGLLLIKKYKEEGESTKKAVFILILGIAIFAGGAVYIYLDLK